jgi:hypothetical protein
MHATTSSFLAFLSSHDIGIGMGTFSTTTRIHLEGAGDDV